MIKNLPQIVLLNIVGLALFLSWYIPINHGFWLPIDADIFYFFNQKLVESKAFLWLVAGNDSNLLIVFYVQIMPDDLVMQLHRF